MVLVPIQVAWLVPGHCLFQAPFCLWNLHGSELCSCYSHTVECSQERELANTWARASPGRQDSEAVGHVVTKAMWSMKKTGEYPVQVLVVNKREARVTSQSAIFFLWDYISLGGTGQVLS